MKAGEGESETEARYRSMKKKLGELKSLRIDSVNADIEDLNKKIDEHKRVHADSVAELSKHNQRLRSMISERQKALEQVEKCAQANEEMRHYLVAREPVLAPFLHPGSGFEIRPIERRTFQVSYGDHLSLRLSRKHDEVKCTFVKFPKEMADCEASHFVRNQTIAFEVSRLNQFFTDIIQGLRFCSLES